MKRTLLTLDEVDDFYALNVPLEAEFFPDAALARAIAEHRVQRGICTSSMGTAELYWAQVAPGERVADAREDCAVVPPGHEAANTPYEDRLDDRDSERYLWRPFRREQRERLAGAIPDVPAAIATAECNRIVGALDARYRTQARVKAPTLGTALDDVMTRIDELSDETLDRRVLRFEILRTLVQIAWNRPWRPVDVTAAWWD